MKIDRRNFISLSGKGVAALTLGGGLVTALSSCKDHIMNPEGMPVIVAEGPFTRLLPIPPVIGSQGALTAQYTNHEIVAGHATRVLGYQADSILGPTIDLPAGSTLDMVFQNKLSDRSNIHWHGLTTPANMDGHPEDVIQPGGSFNYNFVVDQRSAMYWYHPHPGHITARQAYMGLAGAFIVRDATESMLGLPSGEFEVPLIIQDKRLLADYSLDYSPQMHEVMTGYMGASVLVNGVHSPLANVESRSYRFRILNGSNARIYNLGLSNGAPITVIGSDGGLLEAPQSADTLLIGPGERADVIVDFSGYAVGTELHLVSRQFAGGVAQGVQEFKVMKIVVTQASTDSYTVPGSLSAIVPLAEASAVATRTFSISNDDVGHGGMMNGMHRINNKIYDKDRIDEVVQAGTTEVWVFDNSKGTEPHPMHVHSLQFQVLDRTGGRGFVTATEKGWKDTVLVMPREKVRVIMTFPRHKGNFILHCHNLEHEDDGMMLQYRVD